MTEFKFELMESINWKELLGVEPDPADIPLLQLIAKGYSITEIAKMVGYKDPSGISKRLRKYGGVRRIRQILTGKRKAVSTSRKVVREVVQAQTPMPSLPIREFIHGGKYKCVFSKEDALKFLRILERFEVVEKTVHESLEKKGSIKVNTKLGWCRVEFHPRKDGKVTVQISGTKDAVSYLLGAIELNFGVECELSQEWEFGTQLIGISTEPRRVSAGDINISIDRTPVPKGVPEDMITNVEFRGKPDVTQIAREIMTRIVEGGAVAAAYFAQLYSTVERRLNEIEDKLTSLLQQHHQQMIRDHSMHVITVNNLETKEQQILLRILNLLEKITEVLSTMQQQPRYQGYQSQSFRSRRTRQTRLPEFKPANQLDPKAMRMNLRERLVCMRRLAEVLYEDGECKYTTAKWLLNNSEELLRVFLTSLGNAIDIRGSTVHDAKLVVLDREKLKQFIQYLDSEIERLES